MSEIEKKTEREYPGIDRPACLVMLWTTILSLLISIYALGHGFEVLPETGPPARNAEVTRSLWREGSLAAPEFVQFDKMFRAWAVRDHVRVRQDVFALGADGRLLPKHSPISAYLALPFYAFLGEGGFWACQQFCIVLTLLAAFQISRVILGRDALLPFFACSAFLSQTFICLYSFIFSYDLHGCMLLICGLYLLRMRPAAGGLVMGASIFVRLTNAFFFPFLLLAWRELKWRDYLLALAGMAAAFCAFLLFDWHFFGNPFVTAYNHLPLYQPDGSTVIETHPHGLNWAVFVGDWNRKLLDPEIGFLSNNPEFWLWPIAIVYAARARERRFLLCTSIGALAYTLYIFSYEEWDTSFFGNRFLMPAIMLGSFALISLLAEYALRLRGEQ